MVVGFRGIVRGYQQVSGSGDGSGGVNTDPNAAEGGVTDDLGPGERRAIGYSGTKWRRIAVRRKTRKWHYEWVTDEDGKRKRIKKYVTRKGYKWVPTKDSNPVPAGVAGNPRYWANAENEVGTWDAQSISNLQADLAAAHLFSNKKPWYAEGVADDQTLEAVRQAMKIANIAGRGDFSWEDVVAEQVIAAEGGGGPGGGGSGGGGGGGSGGGGGKLPYGPEELGLMFDKASQETIGRFLTPPEKDAMIAQWYSNPDINPEDLATIETRKAGYQPEYQAEQMGRLGAEVSSLFDEDEPGGRLTGGGY